MSDLIKRYLYIKDEETDNETDDLIRDCFRFGIFKLKPSRKHKFLFRKRYKAEYPVYTEQLNKALQAELEKDVRWREQEAERKEDAACARKYAKQRAGRGFSDRDVWNFCDWFVEVIPRMLQELKNDLHGYPRRETSSCAGLGLQALDCNAEAPGRQWWEAVLNRMIFLLDEMNEKTCSNKNPYQERFDEIWRDFENRYGFFGDGLKTDRQLVFEKRNKFRTCKTPADCPDLYPDYDEIRNNYHAYEDEIAKYRDRCTAEFFALFAKHFWDLWD